MTRRTTLLALLAASYAWAADPLPSAESLLDRYVEATGGRAAYEKRQSEILRGTMEYAAQGIKGRIERYSAEGGLYYATLEVAGLGAIQMGVKDGIAWERSDVLGPRVKDGLERAEALREATLNSSLHWRRLFPKVETEGVDTIGGEECYRIAMTPSEGQPQTLWVSRATGLAMKLATVSSTQMGEVPVEIITSQYRDFGGILAPASTTQRAAGQEFTITLESVDVNAEIPPSRFAFPADVQALLDKRATGR